MDSKGGASLLRLWLGWGASGEIRSQLGDDKFLEDIGDSGFPEADEGVGEDEASSVTIVRGIVEIGDSASSDIAEDAGVVGLPVAVVALADDGTG